MTPFNRQCTELCSMSKNNHLVYYKVNWLSPNRRYESTMTTQRQSS